MVNAQWPCFCLFCTKCQFEISNLKHEIQNFSFDIFCPWQGFKRQTFIYHLYNDAQWWMQCQQNVFARKIQDFLNKNHLPRREQQRIAKVQVTDRMGVPSTQKISCCVFNVITTQKCVFGSRKNAFFVHLTITTLSTSTSMRFPAHGFAWPGHKKRRPRHRRRHWQRRQPVWPDLWKFRHYGNKNKVANSWKVYLVLGNIFNLL